MTIFVPDVVMRNVDGNYRSWPQENYSFVADRGNYVLTGQNNILTPNRRIISNQGAYGLTGRDVNLIKYPPVATTDRSKLALWYNADTKTTGGAAGVWNDPSRPGYWGWNNNGRIISSSNPYPGKTKSIYVDFPSNGRADDTYEFTQGFFFESLQGLGLPQPHTGDTIWFSLRMRPSSNFDWSVGTFPGPVNLKFLHFRNDPPSPPFEPDAGGNAVFSMLQRDGTSILFDNGEIGSGMQQQIPIYSGPARPPPGQWTTLEIAMVVDNVPLSAGGTGQFRYYVNGQLMGKITNQITQRDNWPINEVRFISNWNNLGPLHAQSAEFADVCLAMKVAGQRDDTGWMARDIESFPYIGI